MTNPDALKLHGDSGPDDQTPKEPVTGVQESTPTEVPAPSASQETVQEAPIEAPEGDEEGLVMVWESLLTAIQRRIQPEQFETWFRRAGLTKMDDEVVVVAVPNGFARTWLEDYYRSTIEQSIQAVLGVPRRLEIKVDPEFLARTGAPASPSPEAPRPAPSEPAPDRHSRDMLPPGAAIGGVRRTASGLLRNSDVVLNPKYTFVNFVVGPCNRFGHAAAMGAAEQPGKNYNPFFLHGNVGVGKTHLLQGLCHMILERTPESRILYLSCETFVNHFISALENGDLTKFRNKYRNVDVLVVDDIHILANKDRTQEEFFHTFNTLYNAGKQIVLSSDSPPKDIPTLQDRLVSRFKWGMVTEMEPPCFETRMAIIKRKSRDKGLEFPDDVVGLIAEHVTDNVRELEGAVTRLSGYIGITGEPMNLTTAREALSDLFKVTRGEPTMEDIITVVTDHYGIKQVDLQGKRRTQAIAYPRQIAMFLARHITRHSLEEIGAYFGGRDHSTVLYGVDKIRKKAAIEAACKTELETLLGRLGGKGLED
ncbi:MAG: chromosomal replication initiator protein [Planctomycetota bacterium]|jgi:chromosomal replication initiator protein